MHFMLFLYVCFGVRCSFCGGYVFNRVKIPKKEVWTNVRY
jgi:hypothetical protein